ncbi:MAG: Rne/Rng family ribonuclease [Paludibacteraceae bacterium]|nr:Rne/Rng family ribonuclease [Paludibacteraceae bacterium]
MDSKLLLDVTNDEINIALLEDSTLVEYYKEKRSLSYAVGDIYLAKVKKLLPGLNAAFVDVGYEKEGFLHYLDLGVNFNTVDSFVKNQVVVKGKHLSMGKVKQESDLPKVGHVTDVLSVGREILVQVTKEPISTKGPRLTAEISLAGRSVVLMPFYNKVSVSQKIVSYKERNRLRKIVKAACPNNYGAIVRTVAEGKSADELENELEILVERWEEALVSLQKNRKSAPFLVVEEVSRAEAILRDHLNRNFESIVINDKDVYEEIKSYIGLIEPSKSGIVKYYDDQLPVFDVYNVTKQLKSSFGRIAPFSKGAYLVIDHTEAMHVIDVNSGIRVNKDSSEQEESAFEVNMMAVDEVAHQLRLRDMGGIVIIDLIDMHTQVHNDKVYERMVENLKSDSAKHNVLPITKFGLMQITRQRVRPVTYVNTMENCPICGGSSKIYSSILFTDVLERKAYFVFNVLKVKKALLYVHPYVYAYLKQGFISLKTKMCLKHLFRLKILPNQNFSYLQYQFVDADGGEIDVTEEVDSMFVKVKA